MEETTFVLGENSTGVDAVVFKWSRQGRTDPAYHRGQDLDSPIRLIKAKAPCQVSPLSFRVVSPKWDDDKFWDLFLYAWDQYPSESVHRVFFFFVHWSGAEGKITHLKEDSEFPPPPGLLTWSIQGSSLLGDLTPGWLQGCSSPCKESSFKMQQDSVSKYTFSVSRSDVSNSLWPDGLQPTKLLCPWNLPGKNTGVGCHFFLHGIFLTQGSNQGLLHCRQILYHLSPRETLAHKLIV